jgi:hypothetical protein
MIACEKARSASASIFGAVKVAHVGLDPRSPSRACFRKITGEMVVAIESKTFQPGANASTVATSINYADLPQNVAVQPKAV